MPLLNDGARISCDRWHHSQGGVPRPVVHAPPPLAPPPCQNSATKWDTQKREVQTSITSSNLTETQNKSSVANKLVDMAMENMYSKIIAFARFHLYLAILYFCLQKAHLFSQYFHFRLQNFIILHVYIYIYIYQDNFLYNSDWICLKEESHIQLGWLEGD